ncbi:DUF5316 domain-containing protein [Virgibacillus sp. JSM 102003]|uniref:DUF5316 domain-containing protein n=1 Tax=Virgibacillus sp. JSM 102003 TaxID=1562108 RepID=UPI0035BF2A0F
MLKYLGIGVIFTIIALVIGVFTGDWNLFFKLIAASAVIPLVLSGLLTGAFVDGDRNRANYHTGTKKDRQDKNKWVTKLLIIGVPNFSLLIILIILGF